MRLQPRLHDHYVARTVILTVHAKREAQVNQVYPEKDKNKPWKSSRAIGGWEYAVMRPRLADYKGPGNPFTCPDDPAILFSLNKRIQP